MVAIFFNHPAQRPAPQVFHGAHAAVDVVGYSSNGTLIDGTLAVRMLS